MAGITTYDLYGLRNYTAAHTGNVWGWYDLSTYAGRPFWFYQPATGYGDSALVPSSNIHLYYFVGRSPQNEWGTPPGGGGGK